MGLLDKLLGRSKEVAGGVKDTAGNTINPNTSVAARVLGWNAIDLGNMAGIQSRRK
jgi:hypothetical protein